MEAYPRIPVISVRSQVGGEGVANQATATFSAFIHTHRIFGKLRMYDHPLSTPNPNLPLNTVLSRSPIWTKTLLPVPKKIRPLRQVSPFGMLRVLVV